ncbi:MAG TPA: hypothetical protein VKE27_00895 [Candidatus Dormibacteraeota bacterium]|nr:hypothetical protein [Candidatus Dormibacteraeota bacterium]
MLVATAFIVALVGVLLGAWWTPFFAGAAIGLVVARPLAAIPLGGLSGFVSWLLPLAAIQVRYGLGPTATSLAAIMGFDHRGALPVALTLLVGLLLGFAGAWLTCAARMLARPEPRKE